MGHPPYDATETVLLQAIDIERLVARQSDPSQLDFGSGLYMTKSYQTADIFAQRQGLFGRQGGPAVILINVSKRSWDYFLANGAKEDAPISSMAGHFQDFVPLNLVEFFNVSARFAMAPAP